MRRDTHCDITPKRDGWKCWRPRRAELWLTRNLVQKFKTRRETQTSTCANGGHKGLMYICTYSLRLSLSLAFSFYVTPPSASFMEVCLCSWNSEREQTTRCNQNLRNWQRWWHRTCLPAQNIPDKSTYLLRWYSKWVVYILLPVLITNNTNA